ncbi:uncharacterized protein LOC131643303 [Vicia villosa]|uniref:uncharacterized protein LOC131643303 n=1 Tax=Vicia villosa TaxID=3911 RepID=UPI00273B7544|nr:uncharacterized protein LOC131643303 [Vicia villosa]
MSYLGGVLYIPSKHKLQLLSFFNSNKMQTTSLALLPIPPSSCSIIRRSAPFISQKNKSFISASKRESFGQHYDGKMVDENMIILRMRIREIEMLENKSKPPSHWTEWEKKYFENYGSDVCDGVGLLQTMLMNTRPGLVVGILAMIMLSMSMSMSLLVSQMMELANASMLAFSSI